MVDCPSLNLNTPGAAIAPVLMPHPAQIVLIDSSPGDITWFKLRLEDAAFTSSITVFSTPQAALDWLSRNPAPDAIVTEWFLPARTADEFIPELRAIPHLAKTPILVLSGISGVREQAIQHGASGFYKKPLDDNELSRFVGNLRRYV